MAEPLSGCSTENSPNVAALLENNSEFTCNPFSVLCLQGQKQLWPTP